MAWWGESEAETFWGGGSKRERERQGGSLRNVCAFMCEEKWGCAVVEGMGYMCAPKVQEKRCLDL